MRTNGPKQRSSGLSTLSNFYSFDIQTLIIFLKKGKDLIVVSKIDKKRYVFFFSVERASFL